MASPTTQEGNVASAEERQVPWAALAWISLVLIAVYFPILKLMVGDWMIDENMGHGFFVPAVAGYLAWLTRDSWLSKPFKPAWWGLLIVAGAAIQAVVANVGAELFLARTAFIVSIAGILVTVGGLRLLREFAFHLFLLCFMVPLPAIIYNQVTRPLQLFASILAEHALSAVGIPVLREGNILVLATQQLSVEEACSGIRSLLSLSFLSLVYGEFFDRKPWMKWVLLVSTVPIAIAANAGRVTLTGILTVTNPDLAEGFFHSLEGWVIFMVALALLVATHFGINWIYGFRHGRQEHESV
jgi:exosortase